MLPVNELFTLQDRENILAWMAEWPRWLAVVNYRKIPPQKVKTVFYGDSITDNFPLNEFFPNASLLNRGIGGDTADGLYFRLDEDVFPYHPEQVVMLIGINGIERELDLIFRKITAVAFLMKEAGIKVWLASVTPLRKPDQCNRFRYQDKIVELNARLRESAERNFAGFLDYHSVLKDENGELRADYARDDGTHLTFSGYQAMAKLLADTVSL